MEIESDKENTGIYLTFKSIIYMQDVCYSLDYTLESNRSLFC